MPHAALEQLAADYWDAFLERNPTQGTVLGDHRYDDRLNDITPAGRAAAERRLDELAERLANLDTSALTDEEALSVSDHVAVMWSGRIEQVGSDARNCRCAQGQVGHEGRRTLPGTVRWPYVGHPLCSRIGSECEGAPTERLPWPTWCSARFPGKG